IDQVREVRYLTLHHINDAARWRILGNDAAQEFSGITNGREGIAQLVREHREEFIFLAIRFFKLHTLPREFFLREVTARDVGSSTEPFEHTPVFVADRNGTRGNPANAAIEARKAMLNLEYRFVGYRFLNCSQHTRTIVLIHVVLEPGFPCMTRRIEVLTFQA